MDTIILNNDKIALCAKYAKTCCMGGPGWIRSNVERKPKRRKDNIIGQMGTLAGSIFLYGEDKGTEEYIKARIKADKNPYEGDGGRDLPDLDIDIKCSHMMNTDPLSYNFLIRPQERHENWIYIQTLAQQITKQLLFVHIMGWIRDEDVPSTVVTGGKLKGAYLVPIPQLKKFPKSKGLFEEYTMHTLFSNSNEKIAYNVNL